MTDKATFASQSRFDLERIYKPIAEELQRTTETIKERLSRSGAPIDEYLEYSFRLGGKRLRPALLLLTAKALGNVDRRCVLCAAALELIHTGSLVHDDVLDGARFRRSLETINAKWDTHRAVLIGDLLITRALELVCECDDSFVFRKIAESSGATVEGELFQTEAIGDLALGVDDYFKIVGGKTASLLECATSVGARLAGADGRDTDAFSFFGRSLGVAFQIVDDALDLVGDEDATGKTLGSDLANQKATLPLIYYFQRADAKDAEALRERVARGVATSERAEIAQILRASGAVDAALEHARRMVDDAIDVLKEVESRVSSRGRACDRAAFESLAEIARFIVRRDA